MTSNVTPSGVASCSDAWTNMDAWTAFRHAGSGWHPSDVVGNFAPGHWVQYQFERPVTFNLVKEGAYSSNVIASPTFDIKISNDGVSFTTIGQIQHINGTYQQTKFDKLYTCKYIRFEFAHNYGYSNSAGGFDFQVIYEQSF